MAILHVVDLLVGFFPFLTQNKEKLEKLSQPKLLFKGRGTLSITK